MTIKSIALKLLSDPDFEPPPNIMEIGLYNDTRVFLDQFCKRVLVKFAVDEAKSILHIFEDKFPKDQRPGLAIRAIEDWLANPTTSQQLIVEEAANSAWRASNCGGRPGGVAYIAYAAACTVSYRSVNYVLDIIYNIAILKGADSEWSGPGSWSRLSENQLKRLFEIVREEETDEY